MKTSCIIPAYNEGERISNVLSAIIGCRMIDEIIVIDDCSTDNTYDVVNKFEGVTLIKNPKNYGKTKSISIGLKKTYGDLIMLIDADLVGLNKDNICELLRLVSSGEADISISLRGNAPILYRKIGLDFLSGERVFHKKFLSPHIKDLEKLPKFGLESYMNNLIIKNKLKLKVVEWPNVKSPWKYEKIGFLKGILGEIKMNIEIFKTIGVFGVFRQIFNLLSLKLK